MARVRPMTAGDLAFGLALSQQASWNQTEADWRRALDLQPDGCFVAEIDGVPVGTATTCVFGRVAWVALVLVESSVRRQGIGRGLLEHALAFLDDTGVASVRLDATPLGQPLYERLGFVEQFRLNRFEGVPAGIRTSSALPIVAPGSWEALADLDRTVTATDRRRLLRRLFADWPEEVRGIAGSDSWKGLLAARRGAQAVQLGPCLGEAGESLLRDAFHRHTGQRIYLDVPGDNGPACRLAREQGLTVQRPLTRMCRGQGVCERLDLYWASGGPEKG